jgi:hypothetical protein
MENFFSYISKPVDKEDFQLWIEGNNICYQKFDLYRDFVLSLISLINETYLGDEIDRKTNIMLDESDKINHFEWCWEKTINNFKKEKIFFNLKGEHYNFLQNFLIETFYNQKINEVKNSLNRFFDEIFNLDSIHTRSDLDLLGTLYISLDKNLENNNLQN